MIPGIATSVCDRQKFILAFAIREIAIPSEFEGFFHGICSLLRDRTVVIPFRILGLRYNILIR